MDFINAALLGIIEGITEFLPISSTGHLIIAEHWLGERSELFNVVIQAGAILAVTLIYWKRIVSLLTGWSDPEARDYLQKIIVAFVITCVLGLIVKKMGFELPTRITPVAWALVIGGVWMILAETVAARLPDRARITWTVAIAVGIAQIVAGVFPGTSRSATTIFIAMLLGTSNRPAATEFAFLVGIPTMYAASGFELLSQIKDGGIVHEDWTALIVAVVFSTVTAFIAVKWLLGFIQTHRFTSFAIYRLIFGGLLLALASAGTLA
ncbi:undecaprenyl-diphosphate phosphatase [Pseudooceanicola sp. CBS1P-1]|uniref:Undecaprenyl-diphosphatase n=1 Tax=Pseudooceanicola albus TaxID=2692189 RepID=A0A6L7GB24_9RHOB|nr:MULTISPECIES: undecaprenyl-diphosphate phosphatase [Pseudooceanicola]MBT9385751.1 undecaprenyl-diphosphate phosphatase [Pseudooceanicola endophyticus]MXN19983.1 undecaprenyl-diphosphate phosphatase [Pseudooceanicola albus]